MESFSSLRKNVRAVWNQLGKALAALYDSVFISIVAYELPLWYEYVSHSRGIQFLISIR